MNLHVRIPASWPNKKLTNKVADMFNPNWGQPWQLQTSQPGQVFQQTAPGTVALLSMGVIMPSDRSGEVVQQVGQQLTSLGTHMAKRVDDLKTELQTSQQEFQTKLSSHV